MQRQLIRGYDDAAVGQIPEDHVVVLRTADGDHYLLVLRERYCLNRMVVLFASVEDALLVVVVHDDIRTHAALS